MIKWHQHILFLLAQLALDDSNSDSDSGGSDSDSGDSDSASSGDSNSDESSGSADSSTESLNVSDSVGDSSDSNSPDNSSPSSRRRPAVPRPEDVANLMNVTDAQLGDIPSREIGGSGLGEGMFNPPDPGSQSWPDPGNQGWPDADKK